MMRSGKWLAPLALVVGAVVPASAQIVTNGSFENGSFSPNGFGFMSLPNGSTAVTGWTVFNAEGAWIGTPNVANWPASNGNMWIDLTGTHDSPPYAGIQQTLSSVIGAPYHVTFDLSVDQSSSVSNGPITLRVVATGTQFQDYTYNPAGGGIQWGVFSYDFVATGPSTDLSFLGTFSAGGSTIGLDNVVVTGVPDPGSLALCGLAAVGICGNAWRRTGSSAVRP